MSWLPESKDHLPLTWWKGTPIYLSAMLALGGAASMILTAILGNDLVLHLVFTFQGLKELKLWTLATYVIVNPPGLMMLFSCFIFWRFGEAVERHLGRRSFVRLLVILLLLSPLLVSLSAALGRQGMCFGVSEIFFGTFIAFATLYPHVLISLIFFSLEAWILAAIIVGVNALIAISQRDWTSLLILIGQVGTAYAYIRYEQGALTLPEIPTFKATPPASRSRASGTPASAAKPKKRSPAVDDILDKISREGMQSLTAEERRILDQASDDLQNGGR